MIEFGSDFHIVENYKDGSPNSDFYGNSVLLADGRQAIGLLVYENGWSRIWMPEYFCYEVIDSIRKTGVKVDFYKDFPGNDDEAIAWPEFHAGDVLLRMNYFGHRQFRNESGFPIPVIEDHSHSPFGHWAKNSNADWCVASLRKSLPIAEGGILWSPRGLRLSTAIEASDKNKELASIRWEAMLEKYHYLQGEAINKDSFRQKYLLSEEMFDDLPISQIDEQSCNILNGFDFNGWYEQKKHNWQDLSGMQSERVKFIMPEKDCESFSFIILCDTPETRDKLRTILIDRKVYPAILWPVPSDVSSEVKDFSERMLSLHCDARYTKNDIYLLKNIIQQSLKDV